LAERDWLSWNRTSLQVNFTQADELGKAEALDLWSLHRGGGIEK
jgi:hypothetical protein